jgi:hypothetical protein
VHAHSSLKFEHGVNLFFKQIWISPRTYILLLGDAFLFPDTEIIFGEINIHPQLMLHNATSHSLIIAFSTT